MARSSYAGADAGARRMQQFLSVFFQAQWNSFLSMVLPLFCKNPLCIISKCNRKHQGSKEKGCTKKSTKIIHKNAVFQKEELKKVS